MDSNAHSSNSSKAALPMSCTRCSTLTSLPFIRNTFRARHPPESLISSILALIGGSHVNRGESVHQLQRAVYSGKVAAERGRRRDEMRAISGSHALLTNIVLAWNTHRMNDVVERLRREGLRIEDDWLRRIEPAHFAHINFRGTLKFSVEKYAAALVQQRSTQRSSAGPAR